MEKQDEKKWVADRYEDEPELVAALQAAIDDRPDIETEPPTLYCDECCKELDYKLGVGHIAHNHKARVVDLTYATPYLVDFRSADGALVDRVQFNGTMELVMRRVYDAFDSKHPVWYVKGAEVATIFFLDKAQITMSKGSFADWSALLYGEVRAK